MGTDYDSNQTSNSTTEINGSTMSRAHSNLEILSQTAAVVEEVTLCGSTGSDCSTSTSDTSPPQPARVTPAVHHEMCYHIQKRNSHYPVDEHRQKSFLALPEISSHRSKVMPYSPPHHHQPAIFLEKKRGFLPPALSFETCGGILVGGQPFSMDTASYNHSPGLYLSYSNVSGAASSCSGGTIAGSKLVGRVMSPPLDQIVPLQHIHANTATISTGSSNNSGGGGGSSPPSGGDGDTVVNSFLANPSNSFSSAGGASVSSSANTASGVPTSSQYQFTGVNVAHASFPIHNTTFAQPHQSQQQPPTDNTQVAKGSIEFSDELLRENFLLRQQMAASSATITNLQNQMELLQNEIRQLRQVPSGKISQIPLEEMLAIMREYGSEVSDTAMPPRKSYVQKASVVRQFRRWNPNFVEWFIHENGKWIPKLGREDEMKRRQEARASYTEQRSKKQKTGPSSSNESDTPHETVVTASVSSTVPVQEEGTLITLPPLVQNQELPIVDTGKSDKSTGDKNVKHVAAI